MYLHPKQLVELVLCHLASCDNHSTNQKPVMQPTFSPAVGLLRYGLLYL